MLPDSGNVRWTSRRFLTDIYRFFTCPCLVKSLFGAQSVPSRFLVSGGCPGPRLSCVMTELAGAGPGCPAPAQCVLAAPLRTRASAVRSWCVRRSPVCSSVRCVLAAPLCSRPCVSLPGCCCVPTLPVVSLSRECSAWDLSRLVVAQLVGFALFGFNSAG